MKKILQFTELPEPPLDPPDGEVPVCPICGEETDTFFKNSLGEIIGCDICVRSVDAWEESA